MAVKAVRLSELASLPERERSERLDAFAASRFAPLNGEKEDLDRQISIFETRYEMSSDEMQKQYRAKQLKETADICSWMMLLSLRDRLGRKAP
jgi:hypothetical protein